MVRDDELPAVAPTLDEELPAVALTLDEELPAVAPTLDEELPAVAPTLGEELPAVAPTLGEELPAVVPTLGRSYQQRHLLWMKNYLWWLERMRRNCHLQCPFCLLSRSYICIHIQNKTTQ